jgi:hypothetical protein
MTRLFLGALLGFVTLAGCTATVTSTSPNGAAPKDGPPIPANQIGTACSGYGTSIGDIAAFGTSDCPAGYCIVNAKDDLDLYCSADCDGHSCPTGYTCGAVTLGDIKWACLKDGHKNSDSDDTSNISSSDKSSSKGDAGAKTDPTKDPEKNEIGTKNPAGDLPATVNLEKGVTYTCNQVCPAAHGTCDANSPNGVGLVAVSVNNGDPTTTKLTSCSQSTPDVAADNNQAIVECFCSGLAVDVDASVDGVHACSDVCASWSLSCDANRFGIVNLPNNGADFLDCSTPPASNAEAYRCPCQ